MARFSVGLVGGLFVWVYGSSVIATAQSGSAVGTPYRSVDTAATAATSAGAGAPEDADAADFVRRDANKDGWLSGSEAIGIRHYDANGNGEIDRAEFDEGRTAELALLRDGSVLPEDIDLFNGLDSTGSGYISGVDIERGGVGGFDRDDDARVTWAEFRDGRTRLRRELEERVLATAAAEKRRRQAAGEPEPPPPLNEELKPRPGLMRGRVLTPDGKPVSQFTIEIVGYDIDVRDARIDGQKLDDPNFIARYSGREGYFEIRLPEGSFGFAASITISQDAGTKRYPLRAAGERQTIDFIEVRRTSDGVVKNLVWDPSAGEIKSGAGG